MSTGNGIALGAVNLPLASSTSPLLRDRFGVPVGLDNDGNATALAEWRLGAGAASTTSSSSRSAPVLGAGSSSTGSLYRGWAELGHVVVDADGPRCQGNCDGRGHLEALATGETAERARGGLSGERRDARPPLDGRAGATRRRAAAERIGHYLGLAIGSL